MGMQDIFFFNEGKRPVSKGNIIENMMALKEVVTKNTSNGNYPKTT